jgi:hypothetical protein
MLLAITVAVQLVAAPAPVRTVLDTECPGWRLAPVMPEVADEITTRTPSWPPNLIPGDFDANGQVDVAVLVLCGDRVQLLAFLATTNGFDRHVVEPPQSLDGRQFLHLIREEYGRDAIGVEYDAVGGHAWIFQNGTWRSVPR